jgi:tetratricopeptide (TPR) repeat protein
LTTLRQLIATYPPGQTPHQLLVWEGATLVDLGRQEQAVEALLAANHHGPPSPDAHFHLARAYAAQGNYQAAVATAQQALALNSTHAASHELLRQLAAREQSPETIRR